jgi:4-hydroxythreonine-4-phosphate dehydrogenase
MKPRIVITLGDPAGIGPEIVAAAVKDPRILACCQPLVVGDPVAFQRYKLPLPKVEMVAAPGLTKTFPIGGPSREAGRSAVEVLRVAVGLLQARQGQALVTAPVSKESLHLAEAGVPGHTEWLARETKASPAAMLMVAGKLRALLLTRHVPIAKVPGALTRKVVEEGAVLAHAYAKQVLKKKNPRLVLCGLNPHAGDGGLIGKEEQTVLEPALHHLRKRGFLIVGPRPADTVFKEMAQDAYDVALAAYHDQGMIPLKLYAPDKLVNVTLGLPFVRTSPGHGTAYDIAGKGLANPKPLKEAILLAAKYAMTSFPAVTGGESIHGSPARGRRG